MDDYTAAQKVEVESFISEVSSVISTMCVLAESPDIDPSGSTFAAYLEEWNQQGSFQVTYTPIEELEQGVASNRNERDEETLRHLYAGETVVSDVRKSNRLNGYYFSIAKPVNRDGRVVGVLRSIVKAEKLLDTSQASSQVTLLGTLLIKEDGTVVPVSKEFEGYEGSTLYQVLEGRGVSSDQIADVRASIENERDVATVMLGKQNGYMTFLTSIRLDVNDWTIVNFTQESSLVEHSESILRLTVYTAALLIVISAAACLAVALVVGRIRKRARRSAERYEVLAEFFDTVLFEYSYPRDTLELTPNARGMFSLSSLSAEGYLAKGIPLIDFLEDDYKRVRMAFENPAPPNELRTITCRARVLSGEYRWFSFTCRYLYEGSQPYMAVGKIVDRRAAHAQVANGRADEDVQQDGVPGEDGGIAARDGQGLAVRDRHGSIQAGQRRIRSQHGRPGSGRGGAFVARRVPSSRSGGARRRRRVPQDGATYQELFDAADRAMYDEKNEGRVEDSV